MAPLSYTLNYLSAVIQHPGLPASRPSWTQYDYLPLVGIAAIILVLIASCGDDDAPVGPRRRNASYHNDSWSDDGESITDVDALEAGHHALPRRPMEGASQGTSGPAPSVPSPSPTLPAPPPYSRRAPFPY
ncbi:hypothetical protein GSI_14572 [Ganoderma sinense ZZ0214-1]|uniref:Uncharacterized protein n=1 Tax=Ganoderma sinense ZZ0214-1 TaxID=1077348 RepID=A0A2G8RP25_9APHY|nr:hypothetical protein GSI_14572 [Ganoderma sinense ZZ0214-1]